MKVVSYFNKIKGKKISVVWYQVQIANCNYKLPIAKYKLTIAKCRCNLPIENYKLPKT
jgi:hypothetical protein